MVDAAGAAGPLVRPRFAGLGANRPGVRRARGLLTRTHGGAVSTSVQDVLTRQASRAAEKDVIAQAAAELVRGGDRIMIEAGTTTAGIVRHLGRRRGVQIVTNSTLVFAHARHNAGITVIMTGGTFHRPSESLVGPVALRAIRDFNVRLAFVGTDGVHPAARPDHTIRRGRRGDRRHERTGR